MSYFEYPKAVPSPKIEADHCDRAIVVAYNPAKAEYQYDTEGAVHTKDEVSYAIAVAKRVLQDLSRSFRIEKR